MGYMSLPSDFNAIVGISNYYCVILKMVVLHDAIKTIQNGIFVFFFLKNKNLFPFKKIQKNSVTKKQVGRVFNKSVFFLNPDCLSIPIVIIA